ncbi:HAMP domain-containing protein [Streptomyces sp. 110]|uniref:histidine kinase n=1 Tax=Streptomyces endocoffeicus TaxID=2898945 RepID=A0ABS1PP69_9ACTN|nr:ATP-binding protein [Streptomyces endocoffeicus]MBL1113844.1 HAMP domain-containing protein [Streptomyces endocoffeicus]
MTATLRRLRPTTERARLTALYGGLLLLAGGVLAGVIYALLQDDLDARLGKAVTPVPRGPRMTPDEDTPPGAVQGDEYTVVPANKVGEAAKTRTVAALTATTLSRLLTVSGIALVVFAVLSLFLAWWMAGRVLRPVGVITATARKLSGENLHQRIDLKGPPGELKALADTFDQMLGRLEQLVTAQQRFAANAAHELRTPLAVQRAAAEIGLADADPERVAWIRAELIKAADTSERLIESLLLLAATDQGIQRREDVEMDETVAVVTAGFSDEAREKAITVTTTVEPLTVPGDPVLLAHLVRNLVANAVAYNHQGGSIRVHLADRVLRVSNTGPEIPADTVHRLFEPFRRLNERAHTPGEGAGLGLSIVASIARAHGAEATADANPGGGLSVRVRFP